MLKDNLHNLRGHRINEKVVVFESDDWGSIRMPSIDAYNRLIGKGVSLDRNPYNIYDSLESELDLNRLFEILYQFTDQHGNYPVITANFIVGNPDFQSIASNGFKEYIFESFEDTYNRFDYSRSNLSILRRGIDLKLIKPQYHGREHLNVTAWMTFLQTGDKQFLDAFYEGVYCLDLLHGKGRRSNLMATLDFVNEEEELSVSSHLQEGMKIFVDTFGYTSASFIAPCNVWGSHVERTLDLMGVRYIQSLRGRLMPQLGRGKYKIQKLVTGQRSESGQIYLVRNAYFEPSTLRDYPWVSRCLDKIAAAFFWKKPAIISTHRLNYIGSLYPENRESNLKELQTLLTQILDRWPDVKFMSSDQLGEKYYKEIS